MKYQCLFEKLVVILKPESKEDDLTDAAAECMFINQSESHGFSFRSKDCSFKLIVFIFNPCFILYE